MHKILCYNTLYASTCFEHYVFIIRRSKLYYTASGIITPVCGRRVHRLRELDMFLISWLVLLSVHILNARLKVVFHSTCALLLAAECLDAADKTM